MKLNILISILLIIISDNIIAQSSFDKGLIQYKKRSDYAKGIIAPVETINKALVYFEKEMQLSNSKKASIYYLKSIYFKSSYCYPEGDNNRKIILNNGKIKGDQLLKKHPNSVEIHYWYAVVYGSWAKEIGALKAAREGVVDVLKSEAETVIKLDDKYDSGAGYMFLGILHLDAPYIPFFLTWPDDEKAVKLIGKSYKMNPNNISTQYYYAKALNEVKRKKEAIKILEKTVLQKPSAEMLLEETSELELCKALLIELKN